MDTRCELGAAGQDLAVCRFGDPAVHFPSLANARGDGCRADEIRGNVSVDQEILLVDANATPWSRIRFVESQTAAWHAAR